MELQLPSEIILHIAKYILPKEKEVLKTRKFYFNRVIIYQDEDNDNPPALEDICFMTFSYTTKTYEKTNDPIVTTFNNLRLTCKTFAGTLESCFAYNHGIGSFMRKQYIQVILTNYHLSNQYLLEYKCRNRVVDYLENGTVYYGKIKTFKCNPFTKYKQILKNFTTIVTKNDILHNLIKDEFDRMKHKNKRFDKCSDDFDFWVRLRIIPFEGRFLH